MSNRKKVDHEIYGDPVEDYETDYNQFLQDNNDLRPIKADRHHRNHGFGCFFKGLFDGFGGPDARQIGQHIRRKCSGRGGKGISNFLNSHKLDQLVRDRMRRAEHHFGNIHPDTGRIIGAIKGNDFFNFGGLHNNLSDTGKIILDNIMKRKCKKRKIHKFVRPGQCCQKGKRKEQPPSEPKKEPKKEPEPKVEPKIDDVIDYGLDFAAEREKCLKNQTLFEDPEFPANDRSLYYLNRPKDEIEWKRPGEIVSNPQLIVGGESRFDVKQGQLGNCWFLAAVANLTLHDALFYRVVPPDQSFTENYAGIFHFEFWYYGKWVDVVIDDRLPTVDGKLYYMHSDENNEFWSALLEKAYAKLYGSYEHLDGGTTAEALEDFTGGLTEFLDLRKIDKTTVLAALVRGMEMGSLFACSIDADANIREASLSNGLICGHAYSVTSIHDVTYRTQNITLLRLRNPWGNSKEWNGAWSDNSPEWNQLDSQTKKDMNVQFKADGEFWITFDDFYANFTQLECCNLSAEVFDDISDITGVDVKANRAEKCWQERCQDGQWSRMMGTAGGCNNYPDSYYTNPQFGATVTAPKESVENDGKVTVIVAVLQKFRREMRSQGKDSLPIGVAIYEINDSLARLGADFFTKNRPVARTTVFIDMREVSCHFRVPPGNYVAVPCTFEPDKDGEFLLRAYANSSLDISLLK